MHKALFLLCAPALFTACVSVSTTEEPPGSLTRRVISTPAAIAAYSQGIQVGDTLWGAGQISEVYVTYFPESPPARAAYAVAAIPRGLRWRL